MNSFKVALRLSSIPFPHLQLDPQSCSLDLNCWLGLTSFTNTLLIRWLYASLSIGQCKVTMSFDEIKLTICKILKMVKYRYSMTLIRDLTKICNGKEWDWPNSRCRCCDEAEFLADSISLKKSDWSVTRDHNQLRAPPGSCMGIAIALRATANPGESDVPSLIHAIISETVGAGSLSSVPNSS